MMMIARTRTSLTGAPPRQSIWHRLVCGADRDKILKLLVPWGPMTRQRLLRTVSVYGLLYSFSAVLFVSWAVPAAKAFAVGLLWPGAGFLTFVEMSVGAPSLAVGLGALCFVAFLLSLVLWFATGNVLAPVLIWSAAAMGAAVFATPSGSEPNAVLFALPIVCLAGGYIAKIVNGVVADRQARRRLSVGKAHHVPANRNEVGTSSKSQVVRAAADEKELSPADLARVRLLLDRALQPIERFDGFEWGDPYQTAAVRYQVNFMSYALSMMSARFCPAATAYMRTAHCNLVRKALDPRIWKYWQHENLWGYGRGSADPIARDNIMFSGFLSLQLGLAERVTGLNQFNKPGTLAFDHSNAETYRYSAPKIAHGLAQQYRSAAFGLLACEPNWIYPLCNLITAAALSCHDRLHDTSCWQDVKASFFTHLDEDFTGPDGKFIAARSSLTGCAVPPIGGVVMQAFPCLFLNALDGDRAAKHWARIRHHFETDAAVKRAIWPIDTGNYRFTRASGYAASAAAALELGDAETAARLLSLLDEDCPNKTREGITHRPNASLWSHAVELMARFGARDGLRALISKPCEQDHGLPILSDAHYPDVLIAKAQHEDNTLSLVLYPGARVGFKPVTLSNLTPCARYIAHMHDDYPFVADSAGQARLHLPIHGRTPVRIAKAV